MIERPVTTVIDPELCIGCGLCIRVCPSDTLSMQAGQAAVTGDRSLACGHCAAVCPVEAVRVGGIDESWLRFETFQLDQAWLPHGEYDTAGLVRLMASRRSCRNFSARAVEAPLLGDLVRIATTAPSGTNSQRWTFTVLPDRAAVEALAGKIGAFFRRINRMAENRILRTALKWIGRGQLYDYYRDYYDSVRQGLEDWETRGRDRLFHGAPAVVVVASAPGASCPKEDALLATQNLLLAAHSMGLGTCLVGFAVSALENDPALKAVVRIPDAETVHAVIAIGYPEEVYERWTGRRPATLRIVSPANSS
jgi:nitroreductase/NAD-dependent dihydropyrimidine dehydrogenase PreA subunit